MENIRFVEELKEIAVEDARNNAENGWFDWA